MGYYRHDPGECPVCGAEHCSCSTAGPIEIPQLPARDAAAAAGLVAEQVQATLPGGQFTTGTYDRTKHGPKRR